VRSLLARLACLCILFTAVPFVADAGVQSRTVECEGQRFRYLLSVPNRREAAPALLLLHGAGDTPEPMLDAWHGLAKKEKIVLIVPELPRRAEFEGIAPRVFRCEVEDAKRLATIDARRIYVFGNSMGGYLAYDAAMFDSDYFAAAAVHAMGIAPEYDWILEQARRKTPIAIYMGEEDPLVSLKNVHRTRELLLQKGFPVHYVELKGHDHNYYRVAERINPDIWRFFQEKQLP